VESCMLLLIIMGLSELLKKAGLIPAKFIPLWNLAFSVAVYCCYWGWSLAGILNGLVLGLLSTGCYSSCKNVMEGLGINGLY